LLAAALDLRFQIDFTPNTHGRLFGQFGPGEWVFADHCGQCGVGLHGFAKGVYGRRLSSGSRERLGESQPIVLGQFIRELISFGNWEVPFPPRESKPATGQASLEILL